MSALNFPASPSVNDTCAAPNGVTYEWDGAKWVVTAVHLGADGLMLMGL